MPAGAPSWKALLEGGHMRLAQAGIEEAENKLRWLAGHLLGCGLLDVLRHRDEIPPHGIASSFRAGVERLATDEPVQYVIGETDFMGLRIRCDRRALIPRPETELLAGCAEDFLRARPGRPVAVDACTGSGCLACALALRLPRTRVIATDISAATLDLARENARALGAPVEFIQADLLQGIPAAGADLIVSNPPYVSTDECARLPRTVRNFEPRLALDGGADGLRLISRLVAEAIRVLTSGGQLMMEIGDDQADAVADMLCQTPHLQLMTLKSDCAGKPRVAITVRTAR